MKRNRLLTAAAAACLIWPAAALAAPPAGHGGNDQPQKGQHQAQGHGGQGGQKKGAVVTARPPAHAKAAPPARATTAHVPGGAATTGRVQAGVHQAGSSARAVTSHQGQVHVQGGQGQVGAPGGQTGQVVTGHPAQVRVQGGQGHVGARGGQSRQVAPTFGGVGHGTVTGQTRHGAGAVVGRQTSGPPANLPALSGWNPHVTGRSRAQAGQQWRQTYGGWDNNSPWRHDHNWWRGNALFSLFVGERVGYFFMPGYGYIAPPVAYRTHYWRAGDMLPSWFWRYEVRDYWSYGLPRPPDGCIWVWVHHDVALIDASSGYIIDIVHNAW